MNQQKKFLTSFTTGGLYYREAIKIAELYLSNRDWCAVHELIVSSNLFQARTESSLRRTTFEVIHRLENLTINQLELLVEGNLADQRQLLWLAVCKHYALIYEFSTGVIREKFLRLDRELSYLDWDAFFNSKAEWNDELDQLTVSTKQKMRQVVFRMLHEADLLSLDNLILPTVLSLRVINVIIQDDQTFLLVFPTMESY